MIIKTKTAVVWADRNPTDKRIVYAKVISCQQFLNSKEYKIRVREWVEETYTSDVTDYDGNTTEQTFTKEIEIYNQASKPYSYTVSDALRTAITQLYPTTKTGSELEEHYLIYGHLIVNNEQAVRDAQWEVHSQSV